MRFTPTAFMGAGIGTTLEAIGVASGSFISGGINYGYIPFSAGTHSLNITRGANVDILLVGGGGGGGDQLSNQVGGGGGGVDVISARLLRGIYTITVGTGGAKNTVGQPTSLTGYNLLYRAGGGEVGKSGAPQDNAAGLGTGNCGGSNNSAGGGGGGASQTGSTAVCGPSNIPNGANGGEGLTYNFGGTPQVYGSGGGGGSAANPFAQGGVGGTNAGNGASYTNPATNAINGYGGGGGGQRSNSPGSNSTGGDGTLIIRYIIQ
jgi:hypothetical protein